MNIIDKIKASKARVFDRSMWMEDEPYKRFSYCYQPISGGITYPCCPYCGTRTGKDNTDFERGYFCDEICLLAYQLRYKFSWSIDRIRSSIKREIASGKVGLNGDGI